MWRGINFMKDPCTIVILQHLLWDVKPPTIIEFGANTGGSAFYFADTVKIYGFKTHVYSMDIDLGLYRDDGLGVSGKSPRQVERIKKVICATFNENGLQVTVSANLKVVQFLDVEFNLNDESYKPYQKPNQNPLYVNINSNHPHTVTRNIPKAVNRRLSALSSNENMFKSVVPIFLL